MRRLLSSHRARSARRIPSWLAALLAAGLALSAWPAAAAAFPPELTTSGPLSAIDVSNDLACQIGASGDYTPGASGPGSPDFWGNANFNDAGACGTWLALTSATDGSGTAADLFGPTVPTGPQAKPDFTASSQSIAGSGSSSSPYVMTTVVTIPSQASGATNVSLGTITETDTYIVGQSSLATMISVQAAPGGSGLIGTLYHAGDCFLAASDDGYGTYVSSTGSVQCTTTPNNSPAAREMDLTPAASPAASYLEGNAGAVWSNVSAANNASNPFPDTVDTSVLTDNGMGLSWPVSLTAGGSQTYQFTTQITPNVAPTSSTSAGACSETGIIPITTSEPNGPGQLNYVLDSAAEQSMPATPGSPVNVNIGSGPGVHTLQYWAQDATGEQESTHHTLMVTVEPSGPAVSIVSDQNAAAYEQNATATISVTAAGVNLSVNPSAQHVPIPTTTPGTFMVTKTATDVCGSSTATFTYTVLPPPVLGQSVNAGPVSGTVFIELPTTKHALLEGLKGPLVSAVEALSKGTGFVALTQPRQIPVGSILDTEAGVASITSATNKKGQLFKGNFGSGIFQILQNRKQKGLTRLNLMDRVNRSKVCASVGKGAPKKAALLPASAEIVSLAHAAASKKKVSSAVLALLKGNAHGGFATYGQYSSATVRGTQFTVENRCDGTFTKVTRGVVVVDDFRRHKMIRLTTGKSYLAKL